MKKNYEKPCCSSMVVAVEQAMLAGSGVTVTDGGFTPQHLRHGLVQNKIHFQTKTTNKQ